VVVDSVPEPLRADAKRNRDQIVSVARRLFVERGVDIPMEEIAREAGVGIGTLYRRFPDRGALVLAVHVETLEGLAALARAAMEEEPDAWRALERVVRCCTAYRFDVLRSVYNPELEAELIALPALQAAADEWLTRIDQLVKRAQADCVMRLDVGSGDLLATISMVICHPPELPPSMAEMMRARFLDVMLDGLRVQGNSPLTGSPVGTDDLKAAAAS
jgi:AcrR family transcriptional regulator